MKSLLFGAVLITFLTSCGVQQNLSVSYQLHEGMTKSEVETIMGPPIKSDFYKHVDEWFYCKTGQFSDEHLALFFHGGELIANRNYTVTASDTKGAYGSCERFRKMGNYHEPDIVAEIRNR